MRPVKVGDAVCFYADVKRIGRTSMTIGVEVWVLRNGYEDHMKVTQADFTFVAVDAAGRPRPVRPPMTTALTNWRDNRGGPYLNAYSDRAGPPAAAVIASAAKQFRGWRMCLASSTRDAARATSA